jgi:hypothetical protein
VFHGILRRFFGGGEASPATQGLVDEAKRLLATGDTAGAERILERALAADARHAAGHVLLARVRGAQGRDAEARAALERALRLAPGLEMAEAELAELERRTGDAAAAAARLQRLTARRPDAPAAWHNLGAALLDCDRPEEALAALLRAEALAPALPPLGPNLSRAYHALGRYADAERVERQLLAARPDDGVARFRLANALLAQGKLTEGWAEYESRLGRPGFDWGVRKLPPWDGADPRGKCVRVIAEQGLGDALMFARFVPALVALGARVDFLCRPPLERLLRSSLGSRYIVVRSDADGPVGGINAYVHLLSLPYRLGFGDGDLRADGAYLAVDPANAARWRERVGDRPGLKVGLVWAGNPERSGDDRRSLDPETVAPLGGIRSGVTWFSLQQHRPGADAPFAMNDLMGEVKDLADTAAIIAALDLVIAVDTSVAHCAAALGKPLWLIAPLRPCWRWLVGTIESPWYGGVRMFRPAGPRDWAPVIARVAEELRSAAARGVRPSLPSSS